MTGEHQPKPSAKQEIIRKLRETDRPLAVHEFNIERVSQNNIATRLSEMAKAGVVAGAYRAGEAFKEWRLLPIVAAAALGACATMDMPIVPHQHAIPDGAGGFWLYEVK